MRRWRRIFVEWVAGYVLFSIGAGITLAELQLHPWRRPLSHAQQAAAIVHNRYGTELENVEITAADGTSLNAWYVHPQNSNGRDVLLLHGVQDNREGVAGFAPAFLEHGYSVLLPDSRAHGESGGTLATYGLRESEDIHLWVEWLYTRRKSKCVYGFGESMGAALVLDSLGSPQGNRFCAVVAESPFSSFRSVAYERAALYVRAPSWVGRTLCVCRWKWEWIMQNGATDSTSTPTAHQTPSAILPLPFFSSTAPTTSTSFRITLN